MWVMLSSCCSWWFFITCFAIWNMSSCWNCPRRWLTSIYIICSISFAHFMSKLFSWIMQRLWKQMQVIITFDNFVMVCQLFLVKKFWTSFFQNLKNLFYNHSNIWFYEISICFCSWHIIFFTLEWWLKPWPH
jgi:hypothetical protein